MEKLPQNNARIKVLFLITKSNWGEKWDGVKNNGHYSLQGYQLFLKKIATTCTGPVRTHFARLAQLVCEYLERTGVRAETEFNILFQKVASYFVKNSDNLYCFCKKDSVCKQVFFYCTQLMFVCEHPNKAFVCKSKTEPSRPSTNINWL